MNFQLTIIFVAILGLESALTDGAGELVNGASNWGGSRQYSGGSGISRSRRSPPRAMMSSGWGMKKAEPVRAAPPPTHPPPPPPPPPMPMSSGWGMAKSAPEHPPPPPPPPPPPMKMSGGWPQPMAWMEMKMGGSNEHGFSASW